MTDAAVTSAAALLPCVELSSAACTGRSVGGAQVRVDHAVVDTVAVQQHSAAAGGVADTVVGVEVRRRADHILAPVAQPTEAVSGPEESAVRQRDLKGADAQPRINRVCGAQDIGVDGGARESERMRGAAPARTWWT